MINCSAREAVSIALPLLSEANIPTGGYANGFVEIAKNFNKIGATVDLLKARTDLNPEAYANIADDWIKSGATFIGGCCEVGPAHIAELKRRFG
jgi:Homocysteine/selenocysteine methylase (S-methylmethionine-dependent)